jgi:hypothetical protein
MAPLTHQLLVVLVLVVAVGQSIINVPILVLEADEEFERSPVKQAQHMRTIREFLSAL